MRTTKGFTLIELLIVISISALALSLVGGLTVDSITKFRMKAEQLQLKSFLRQSSHQAFIHEKALTVKSSTDNLRLMQGERSVHFMQFSYLTFDDNQLNINPAGFFSGSKFVYFQNGNRVTVDLDTL